MYTLDIAELYDMYYEPCFRFTRSICRNREDAEDICQSAFIRAMSHLSLLSVLPEKKRRNWLYAVIRNIQIDVWRKKRRRESMIRNYLEATIEEEDQMEQEATRWDMETLMVNLPKQDQELIIKRFWLRMNSTQIGEEINMSPSTVRYRLREALKRLKKMYERRREE